MLDRLATTLTIFYSRLMSTWMTVMAALGISAGVALEADDPFSQLIPLLVSWVLLFAIFLGWIRFSRPDWAARSQISEAIPIWYAGLAGIAVFLTLLVRSQPVAFAAAATGVIVTFIGLALVAYDRFLASRPPVPPRKPEATRPGA